MSPRKAVRRYLTTNLWFIGLVAREWMRGRARAAEARSHGRAAEEPPAHARAPRPRPAGATPAEAQSAQAHPERSAGVSARTRPGRPVAAPGAPR